MILKIGGSVLTDKSGYEDLDKESLLRVAEVVGDRWRESQGELVLIHGAGSFGHPHAEMHGLGEGGFSGVLETHLAVSELNNLVVSELLDAGVDALPVSPLGCSYKKHGFKMMTAQIQCMMDEGFLPVLHGDMVAAEGVGASVVSGDDIAVYLSREMGDRWVGMCSAVPGILGDGGEVLQRVSSVDDVDRRGGNGSDVTGGIHGKVEKLLDLSWGGYVFGVDGIGEFLDGEETGSLVRG